MSLGSGFAGLLQGFAAAMEVRALRLRCFMSLVRSNGNLCSQQARSIVTRSKSVDKRDCRKLEDKNGASIMGASG
jgi:hypothetical protein